MAKAQPVNNAANHSTNHTTNQAHDTQTAALTKQEYERLAEFRYELRRYLRQTELEARKLDLTPQHYQLMLAVKGFPGRDWANITELAERLQIRHNAVIGLVNRAETRGLLERRPDSNGGDRRIVEIHLTEQGEQALLQLASALHDERARMRSAMAALQ